MENQIEDINRRIEKLHHIVEAKNETIQLLEQTKSPV
jgi:prefoldin subunit 5